MKQATSFDDGQRRLLLADDVDGTSRRSASEVEVPSFVELAAQEAVGRARELGLVPAVETERVDDEALGGVVLSQHPAPASTVRRGDVVVLSVGHLETEQPQPSKAKDSEPQDEEDDDWFDVVVPDAGHPPLGPEAQLGTPEPLDEQSSGPPTGGEQPDGAASAVGSHSVRLRAGRLALLGAAVVLMVALASALNREDRPARCVEPPPRPVHSPPPARRDAVPAVPRPERSARPRRNRPRRSVVPPPAPPARAPSATPPVAPCELCFEQPPNP